MQIIDSHIHCGIQNVSQPFEAIQPLLTGAGIQAPVCSHPLKISITAMTPILTTMPSGAAAGKKHMIIYCH